VPHGRKAAGQVRERKARENGPGTRRGKSFKRRTPGEQRTVCGAQTVGGCRILRGRKARKPSCSWLAANLFVGLHPRQRYAGKGPGRTVRFARGTALVRMRKQVGPVRGKSFEGGTPGASFPRQWGIDRGWHHPPRASKRRRRQFRWAHRDITSAVESAVGAKNLRKAVEARKGVHGRFGSHSEGEPKPVRAARRR